MRIGIDIMGGDYAPSATVLGAILARKELPETCTIVLIGDQTKILPLLEQGNIDPALFEIVHSDEIIEMGEHPAKAFAKKQNSSIAIGFQMLSTGKLDGFASAGNTGAMLVGSMYTVKVIPGIIRPCISSVMPRLLGGDSILLDVGINADCRPDVLYQYAVLGSIYAEFVHGVKNPKIGLLNIGSEEEKGNLLSRSTYELMKNSNDFNFIGNIEGNELFGDRADVIVTDGFTGNVVLKEAEAFYSLIKKRKIEDEYFNRFNFEIYGGTPILGINSTVVIGHGVSNDTAIKNMIIHTSEVAEAQINMKIKEAFQ
ncbi:MAG: phosphate acyltransferase PlsX [Bacteroidales bacterium]|nr:phosphate acyltransferase PlsX [Bacteroidales bacterium]MCF8455761.1 phosphate acyltransferase PlsX [Bacteroidales bacterium]